jgi:tRNA(Ile)-lysidine synthase
LIERVIKAGEEKIIERFLEIVEATARRHEMWHRGKRLAVAVSGGPDSVALLDALYRLAAEEKLSLVVAHFEHGLRGPEGEADAEYVRSLAEAYGLEFVLGRGDAAKAAERLGRGIEAGARMLRHRFLQEAAREQGCQHVALGHTASDRVETVLMNLLRGTGLWGLRGMPARRGIFVRPLINVWRSDTESYCRAAGLTWRVDRTNLEAKASLRNKIRHHLIPLLETEYRRRAAEAILRCAKAVEEELAWTEPLVEETADRVVEVDKGWLRVRMEEARELPWGLLVRVLRKAAVGAFGPLWDWSEAHFRSLGEAIRKGRTSHVVVLPAGLEARVRYGWTEVGAAKDKPVTIQERALPVPGCVDVPEAGVRISACLVQAEKAPKPGPHTAVLSHTLAEGLCVRGWRPGDRFFPLGAPGRKKLQDFFVDAKVPRAERHRKALVIHPREGIIWVVGMRIAETAQPRHDAENVLVLEALPSRTR